MTLKRLQDLARSAEPDTRVWLETAIQQWAEGADLAAALGLCGARALAHRNRLLCDAADILDPDRKLTRWKLAELLAARIRRFEAVTLARIKAGGEMSKLDTIFLEIHQLRVPMLSSRRRLYDVLR